MRDAPAVSVLITSYNREHYIAESIESVLAQTFVDFELVVCDDGSTDGTVEIARRYESDPRVRVIANADNVGDYPNRNRAAAFARGRYLKFHDSDDVMYSHCLQVMAGSIEQEPRADFALSGPRSWSGARSPILLTPRLAYEREFLGEGLFHLGPSCALFRREFFEAIGGFTPAGTGSDYLFWFDACAKGNVILVPGDLFYYRVHPGQELVSDKSAADYASARSRAWRLLNSPGCPLSGAALEQARRNFVFAVVRDMYYRVHDGNLRGAIRYFAQLRLGSDVWARYLRRPHRTPFAGTPLRAV